jgi:hypothetical protein
MTAGQSEAYAIEVSVQRARRPEYPPGGYLLPRISLLEPPQLLGVHLFILGTKYNAGREPWNPKARFCVAYNITPTILLL